MGARKRGKTDRQQIIGWLKEELEYYRDNIGAVKEHGMTVQGDMSSTIITQKLIDSVQSRVNQLEEMEQKENANKWRLPELA